MYIKLLKDDPELADGIGEFSGDTEYAIMFGPDKCGGTDKVRSLAFASFASIPPIALLVALWCRCYGATMCTQDTPALD